ncbi:cell division protein FtsZ [uncultured Flavobacterium sp.]|uniref:cell division protein FtsZ n=1 Tax=uncultured Flavobacterium sp. TaxID=165435 RepID=UPI0030EED4C4|tara:strand:- start:121936 stop:123915 length:1980 start_codon:yes stop_codon:yes gene_type:complete
MSNESEFGNISFDLPKNQSNVIKVIGVGGGGSNAINHMFKQGIKGVDFFICNTDSQALANSPVPNKIQLGVNLTEGLGAGANPEVGQQSAIESVEEIEKMLDTNTKMIFITAGMGGGTGTGAAPVIAQLAKERDILTVGIVTIPFQFEGKVRQEQALQGVERLRKQVDSLIVINNNKLREVYGNLGFKAGFSKADEVLATASRGIAEVITHHYTQNIDLKDAKTVLSNSGTAIMGSAVASGDDRAKIAIKSALDSPLLNDNKITGAKNVLLLIVSGSQEITIDEIGEINDFIQTEAGFNANIIMGVGEDDSLEDAVSVTIIATGFNAEQQHEIVNTEPNRIIHSLEDEQKIVKNLIEKANFNIEVEAEVVNPIQAESTSSITSQVESVVSEEKEEKIVFTLEEAKEEFNAIVAQENELIATTEAIKNIGVTFEIISPQSKEKPVFEITSMPKPIREIEVVEPEFVIAKEDDLLFSLDMFEDKKEVKEDQIVFNLDDAKDIVVNEHVEFIPVTEVEKNGIIKHSLEEYLEKENELLTAKPTQVSEPVNPELDIKINTVEAKEAQESILSLENRDLTELTIEETLRLRTEERKRKMKEFNYKFNTNSRIDEIERQPAYKRMGVDLESPELNNNKSRMSLGNDSNDDPQLRSNNSFLHDNVD